MKTKKILKAAIVLGVSGYFASGIDLMNIKPKSLNLSSNELEKTIDVVTNFNNGDICIISKEIPLDGSDYKKKDHKKEKELCSYDLGGKGANLVEDIKQAALCPKLFSTTPAIEVFKLPEGISKASFESEKCNTRLHSKTRNQKKRAKYKSAVGGVSVGSNLGYYHISRALGIKTVPVAVYRTLDIDVHKEIALKGKKYTDSDARKETPQIITKYWRRALDYISKSNKAIVTENRRHTFGSLLDNPRGEQKYYESFWPGSAGSKGITKFKSTKVYRNLSDSRDVTRFVGKSLNDRNYQDLLAMRDAADMLVLDTIFRQADRFGNIHSYHAFLTSTEEGKLKKIYLKDVKKMIEEDGTDEEKRRFARADKMPKDWKKEIVPRNDAIISVAKTYLKRKGIAHAHAQEILLKDNDFGLYTKTNRFAERSMINGIRHISKTTFEQLVKLYETVKSGELDSFISENMKMNSSEKDKFLSGLKITAENLIDRHNKGQLKLDLNVKEHFAVEKPQQDENGFFIRKISRSGVRLRTPLLAETMKKTEDSIYVVGGEAQMASVGDQFAIESEIDVDGVIFYKSRVVSSDKLEEGSILYVWKNAFF